ncbi:3'(2'),5'-bisphosphate nucleotidase CysQ [Pseudomonadota bacterium]
MNLTKQDINFILDLLQGSGKIALKYFESKNLRIDIKKDKSPVTLADIEINKLIVGELTTKFPNIGIVSEEGDWFPENKNTFWLVDPIDGTRSFVKNEKEFTINIGLIKNNKPIYGFIFVPTVQDKKEGILYYTDENYRAIKFDLNNNKKEFLSIKNKNLSLNKILEKPIKIISSGDSQICNIANIISKIKVKELVNMSSSLKFCKMAEGYADLYLHCKQTHEWDTAAGHAIVLASGGRIENIDGNYLLYGKTRFLNPEFVVY